MTGDRWSPEPRRAGPEFPEGNFHSSRGVYRVRALHVGPRNEGQAYSASEMDAVSACAAPDTTQTGVSEYRATASGWNAADTGRAIDRTPPMMAKCNRERGVFWLSRHPLSYTGVTA